jgi:hypothetical protein
MSDFQPLLTRAERAEKERDVLAANVAALADEWEAESSRYEGYGKGRSASHRQCRQIAHTLAESATDLRALLGGDTTALDARLADAWDEGFDMANRSLDAMGMGYSTPTNPYRARAGGTP